MLSVIKYPPKPATEPLRPFANITNLRIKLSKKCLIGGDIGVSKEVTLGSGLTLENEQLSVTSDFNFDAMVANSLFQG